MENKTKKTISFFNSKTLIGICALGLLSLFFTSCANLQFKSGWKDKDIKIDGRSDDWIGSLTYVDKQNISLGVMNDTDYLYVCLAAEDQAMIRRILRQGMILWFNPEGGKNKTLGIKYPVGRQVMPPEEREMKRPGSEASPQKKRPAAISISNELEILQDSKVPITTSIDNLKGIQISLKRSTGLIVYELKIPLKANPDLPFAIGTQQGSEIGIGIEVPKMYMTLNRAAGGMSGRGSGTARPGGNMGGRGGSMRGGSMGGSSVGMTGQRANMQKGVKIWATVQLAHD